MIVTLMRSTKKGKKEFKGVIVRESKRIIVVLIKNYKDQNIICKFVKRKYKIKRYDDKSIDTRKEVI